MQPAEGLHLIKVIGSQGLFRQERCHSGWMPALGSSREALLMGHGRGWGDGVGEHQSALWTPWRRSGGCQGTPYLSLKDSSRSLPAHLRGVGPVQERRLIGSPLRPPHRACLSPEEPWAPAFPLSLGQSSGNKTDGVAPSGARAVSSAERGEGVEQDPRRGWGTRLVTEHRLSGMGDRRSRPPEWPHVRAVHLPTLVWR